MPVWNRANIVERAIKSILEQTFKNYELLIIDDNSGDNLESTIKPYLSDNITYHKISHGGINRARNFGIKHAKGDFIAQLDSDNIWHPEFLQKMHNALTNGKYPKEAAYCKYNVYKKDDEGKIYLDHVRGEEFNFKKLLHGNYIDINTFVYSRKCIKYVGYFDEELKRLGDWDFIVRVASRYDFVFIPDILVDYYFCVHENALSAIEDLNIADKTVRKKIQKYKKKVKVIHDMFEYAWEDAEDKKYHNWIKMLNKDLNIQDYTAWGYPYLLQIEPTNTCNLSCSLCPVAENKLNRPPRHMKLEEFKSIIDDVEDYLLFIVLWSWGEPFMNPELPDMIKYARNKDIKVATSTNAHFLNNSEYATRILEADLSTLIVAIDSLNQENYQVFRKKGNLNKALSGLENIVKLKQKLNSKTLINLRMVITKQNEKELYKMRRFAKKLGVDRFTAKTVNPGFSIVSVDKEIIPDNPRYRRYEYKKGTYERTRIDGICRDIWEISIIASNGDVTACCYDHACELKIGNILNKPFTKIWNGPNYRNLRKKIYLDKDSVPKCKKCGINFKLSKTGWYIEPDIKRRLINKIKKYNNIPIGQNLRKIIDKINT